MLFALIYEKNPDINFIICVIITNSRRKVNKLIKFALKKKEKK